MSPNIWLFIRALELDERARAAIGSEPLREVEPSAQRCPHAPAAVPVSLH